MNGLTGLAVFNEYQCVTIKQNMSSCGKCWKTLKHNVMTSVMYFTDVSLLADEWLDLPVLMVLELWRSYFCFVEGGMFHYQSIMSALCNCFNDVSLHVSEWLDLPVFNGVRALVELVLFFERGVFHYQSIMRVLRNYFNDVSLHVNEWLDLPVVELWWSWFLIL